jgi:hypothetical protein
MKACSASRDEALTSAPPVAVLHFEKAMSMEPVRSDHRLFGSVRQINGNQSTFGIRGIWNQRDLSGWNLQLPGDKGQRDFRHSVAHHFTHRFPRLECFRLCQAERSVGAG